jgi:hypothetical protein
MHKILCLTLFLSIANVACNKTCNDCEPVSTSQYFIKNNSQNKILIIFFGKSVIGTIKDTMALDINERKMLIRYATGTPGYSVLKFDYNLCDSLYLISNTNEIKVFESKNCNKRQNVFCTSNYSVVKEEIINTGKNKGGKNTEYELAI